MGKNKGERGFAPLIIVVIILVAIAGAGTGTYLLVQEDRPIEVTEEKGQTAEPTETAKKEEAPPEKPNIIAKPVQQAKEVIQKNISSSPEEEQKSEKKDSSLIDTLAGDLKAQFKELEKEISEAKESGSFFAEAHEQRIQKDLNYLKADGYDQAEIERLRQLVFDLSPHLWKKHAAEKDTGGEYNTSPSGWYPPKNCSGEDVTFTASPVNEKAIKHITPLGRMYASHITPTDHGYINVGEGITASVFSPAEGEIVEINTFPRPDDFLVVIWHSCRISTMYIHLDSLASEIREHVGDLDPGDYWSRGDGNSLLVSAGQSIGTMRRSVDFSVQDTRIILPGLITPSLYSEAWKIHTADMFEYFAEPLRTTLRQKSERTANPVSGKIDYDIDGRLVGSWFEEGTGGYRGGSGEYWLTHLAIAYDHVFPEVILISAPDTGINDEELCNVCGNVYGVKGNSPDPAEVSIDTGMVKYTLLARKHILDSRTGANLTVVDDTKELGVFLVQMLADRRIKAEAFPGKAVFEVTGFTAKARVYER